MSRGLFSFSFARNDAGRSRPQINEDYHYAEEKKMLAEPHADSPLNAEQLADMKDRLASGKVLPLEEGAIFTRVRLMQNPRTCRRDTNREAAELLWVSHHHLRKTVA